MKKFLLLSLLLVFSFTAVAQVPNCQINFGPWTDVNQSAPSFNGITQCAYWVITYQVTGFSAISLHFQSATGTQAAPGAFADFTGTVATGINPNTSVACSTPTNCTSTFTGTPGWFKVTFPSHTGSGTIQGTLQGYKTGYSLGGNVPASGGCVGTVSTPCVVEGVTAAGAPPTTAPVLIAGQDGTNTQTIKTDTGGQLAIQQATASALNATVVSPGYGTFVSGQQAVTASAVALATNTARAVCVVALNTNTIPVYLGATGETTSTGLPLLPGQSTCQPVNNTNLIFVVASTTGAGVAWTLVN